LGESCVKAVYLGSLTTSDAVAVTGPCSIRGLWICPGTTSGVAGNADYSLNIYDGASSGGSLKFKMLVGGRSGQNNDGKGKRSFAFPGRGIRFDTSMVVTAPDWSSGSVEPFVSVTIFYEGPVDNV